MTDFAALVATADTLTPAAIKAALPIAYVLGRYGTETEIGDDGKVRACCPFHQDSSPSLDLYGEALEKWGCYPCGVGGDVLDLIQRLGAARSFNGAMEVARLLLSEPDLAAWQGPRKAEVRVFDVAAAADRVQAAVLAAQEEGNGLAEFVTLKGYPFDADWLRETFDVGSEARQVVIPYYGRDRCLIGYKHRTPTSKALSAAGTHFTDFYGVWRDTGTRPVLLCEGESDVWAGAFALGDRYDVLGLPTGAGTRPDKFAPTLQKREVVLAFDGDDAGRTAIRAWHPALLQQGCTVRVIPMPDGADLASLPNPEEVVLRARAVPAYPKDALEEIDGGLARRGKETYTMVANWTFTPRRELVAEDGSMAYEGVVEPAGMPAVLSSHDLSSKAQIVKWANSCGGSWFGSDRDAQVLLATLQALGPFLPTGRMTQVAGLHDWHFVGPGVKIGPDYWQYVPPAGDIELSRDVKIRPAPWSTDQVHILRTLHTRAVTDPILAWLAAAPLRSVLHSFPYLGVTGSSGTGKSTLLETLLRQFTGTKVTTNLTSTTRYAVSAMAEATNGIPVWFDEYRPGARLDTITAVNQILRDAFDGAASARGGTKDHWAKVTRRAATAPLIVSGEDTLTETSLVQRTVAISMPLDGKNPEALARVQGWPDHGLAYAYLEWLIGSYQLGRLWKFDNYEAGPSTLPSRNRTGLGVLDLGWRLLSRFIDEHGGTELGEPDLSLVVGEATEAATHSPIEDAIRWAIDEIDAAEFLGRRPDKDQIWVRVQNLIPFVTKDSKFLLPGGSSAVRKYLQQHYDAYEGTVTHLGGQKRVLWVPNASKLLGAQ